MPKASKEYTAFNAAMVKSSDGFQTRTGRPCEGAQGTGRAQPQEARPEARQKGRRVLPSLPIPPTTRTPSRGAPVPFLRSSRVYITRRPTMLAMVA